MLSQETQPEFVETELVEIEIFGVPVESRTFPAVLDAMPMHIGPQEM